MSQFGQWRRSKCEHALQSQPSPDTSPSRLRGRQTQITRVNSPAMSRLESEPKLKANPNSTRCRKEWVRKWRNFPLKNLWIITALRNTAVICFPFMDELEDFWVDEDVTDNENVGGHGVVPPVTPRPNPRMLMKAGKKSAHEVTPRHRFSSEISSDRRSRVRDWLHAEAWEIKSVNQPLITFQ